MDNSALLKALLSGPKTGVALAQLLGISRAAIWKRVDYLRQQGVQIEASEAHGYFLTQPSALIEEALILQAMSSMQRAQISKLHVCFETDSTQTLALNQTAPDQGIEVWLAESQRAGQGRRGKIWHSPPMSNIYCSLNRRFSCSMANMSGFSLAVAVMIADALTALSIEGLSLKWPNDIWLNGKKCAGLLIQLRGESSGPCDVTLGFGLNVAMNTNHAKDIDQEWTSLALENKMNFDRNAITSQILTHLLMGFERYERHGFSAFNERWRDYDGLFGKPILLTHGMQLIEGIAQGVDDDGALKVMQNNDLHRYHSGEVSVRVQHD